MIGPSTAETISDSRISSRVRFEDVAASDPAFGADETGPFEGEQDLLEVGLGEAGAFGDVAHRRRTLLVGVQCQRQQGSTRVVTSGGDAHGCDCRPRSLPESVDVFSGDDRSGGESDRSGLLGCQRPWDRAGAARTRRRGRDGAPTGCPMPVRAADAVVLFVLDGLGWDQLQAHRRWRRR